MGRAVYIYGPSTTPVEAITLTTNTPTYLTYTPSDSSWLTTNTAGDETGFWQYDAYGTLAVGTPTTPFGYAGQYLDPTTGLNNMRARWYEPGTGGFTARDPAFAATDTAYTYAGSDPVNNNDPTGLSQLCATQTTFGNVVSFEQLLFEQEELQQEQVDAYAQSVIALDNYENAVAAQSAGNNGGGFLNDLAAFDEGFSNTLTFGATNIITTQLGGGNNIDTGNGFYSGGEGAAAATLEVLPGGQEEAAETATDLLASETDPQVLNLGSGSNPMPGAVNVDIQPGPGVNVVADANALPFQSGTFDEAHSINPYGYQPVSPERGEARALCRA